MKTSIRPGLKHPRTWSLAVLCALVLNAPFCAQAQTSSSNGGANQPTASTQQVPGNSPFTFVPPGTDKKSTKRTDSGKNEK
jgi:hypothetical protein